MSVEVTGLDDLIGDFARAPGRLALGAYQAVEVNARLVRDAWRAGDSGLKHAPAYPAAIGYDIVSGTGWVEGTVGPDKDKAQGALGNLIEYGSAHNPPRGTGARALAENAADLEYGLARAVADAT